MDNANNDDALIRQAVTNVRDNAAKLMVDGVKGGGPVHLYRDITQTFVACDLWLKFADAAQKENNDTPAGGDTVLVDRGPRPG